MGISGHVCSIVAPCVYIYIYMMFGCNLARHLHFEVSHV